MLALFHNNPYLITAHSRTSMQRASPRHLSLGAHFGPTASPDRPTAGPTFPTLRPNPEGQAPPTTALPRLRRLMRPKSRWAGLLRMPSGSGSLSIRPRSLLAAIRHGLPRPRRAAWTLLELFSPMRALRIRVSSCGKGPGRMLRVRRAAPAAQRTLRGPGPPRSCLLRCPLRPIKWRQQLVPSCPSWRRSLRS